ncbi:hypothetical protein JTE90_027815 [Oedothorax gibbosus]|uniref:Uncharacterized protein n=1 Tax=Oedothorax gibbosus TaxID=931172 RepID=A0AAV6V969_9ARAC|nr:hypothetical protein JTE90_027815 [Oedothorax gibbosus]
MDNVPPMWMLLLLLVTVFKLCLGLRCYTCSVDFRSEPFSVNNSCMFPRDHDEMAGCSHNSKYCKAIITRITGVFVMLQRSCADDCMDACTEKGYGVRIQDCTKCCKDGERNVEVCGFTELIKERKPIKNIGSKAHLRWKTSLMMLMAIITRICGVFVMLQRSCADDCMDACTEKGYGVRIQDCTTCCKDGQKDVEVCGSTQLIKNGTHGTH